MTNIIFSYHILSNQDSMVMISVLLIEVVEYHLILFSAQGCPEMFVLSSFQILHHKRPINDLIPTCNSNELDCENIQTLINEIEFLKLNVQVSEIQKYVGKVGAHSQDAGADSY